jgi:hypothetical protein
MRYKLVLGFLCLMVASERVWGAEVIFPIYANTNSQNCRFWISGFSIFNANPSPITATFDAFGSVGILLNSGSVSVRPYTSAAYVVPQTAVGWLRVTMPDSVIVKESLQVLDGCPTGNPPPGGLGIADVRTRIDLGPAAVSRHHFVNFAFNKDTGTNTGLSIAFPSASGTAQAKGQLVQRGSDGVQVSEKEFVIPANGQLVGMISDLIPDLLKASGTITGSLEVSFDNDVAVAALQFGWDQPLEENVLPALGGAVQ